MKRIVCRNCSLGLLIVSIIIYGLAGILSGIGLYMALVVEDPAFIPVLRYIVVFFYAIGFCIPCIVLIVMSCVAFTEKIIITEDAVELRRGKKQIGYIPCREITVYGCAAFMHRNGYTFFCSTPLDQILIFSERNQQKTVRFFGKHRVAQAESHSERMLQIAVGTYIHSKRRKDYAQIIILKSATPKLLKEIGGLLHKEPVLTGSIIMDYPDAWA